MTPESIGSGVAAFFTTIGVLAVLYLGLLGFLHRIAERPLEYLVSANSSRTLRRSLTVSA